jgi:antitoxin FitA
LHQVDRRCLAAIHRFFAGQEASFETMTSPDSLGQAISKPRSASGSQAWHELQIGAGSEPMPVNLSIKNAPCGVVERLRQRAKRRHRSLQGELLAIIEEAALSEQQLSSAGLLADVRRLGVRSPRTPQSSALIVIEIKIRRQPSRRQALRAAFQLGRPLRVDTVAVDHGRRWTSPRATGLTAYDAVYPCLTRAPGAELVTLNWKLAATSA